MSGVFIKEEIKDNDEQDSVPAFNLADTHSRSVTTPVSVCTVPVPPTQRVMPSNIGMAGIRRGLAIPGFSLFGQESSDTDKIKKFLVTLISFSEGISASAGAGVKRNVISLLSGNISAPEFLRQLQLITTFPVRPFVLPFLQSNIPRLRDELQRLAHKAGCSLATYMANNDSLLEPSGPVSPGSGHSPKANEIFHCESATAKLPGLKRKFGGVADPGEGSRPKLTCTSSSLISPPLFKPRPNLAMVPGYPHETAAGVGVGVSVGAGASHDTNQEDEWKNIKVMLNCISGMVEKTQRAISILQQRQAEAANVRSAEELVADIQTKASLAIMEVKTAALEEIRQMKQVNDSVQTKSKEEACWNCGRLATETCSGCGLARYCSAFCQHKDWEHDHARVCRQESLGSPDTGDATSDNNAALAPSTTSDNNSDVSQ